MSSLEVLHTINFTYKLSVVYIWVLCIQNVKIRCPETLILKYSWFRKIWGLHFSNWRSFPLTISASIYCMLYIFGYCVVNICKFRYLNLIIQMASFSWKLAKMYLNLGTKMPLIQEDIRSSLSLLEFLDTKNVTFYKLSMVYIRVLCGQNFQNKVPWFRKIWVTFPSPIPHILTIIFKLLLNTWFVTKKYYSKRRVH